MAIVRNPTTGALSRVGGPSGPGMAQPFASRTTPLNTALSRATNQYSAQSDINALSRTLPRNTGRGAGGPRMSAMRAMKRTTSRRSSR